ncbi:MAG: glycoside hydrolase family 127 protein [Cyclobacteriaceae bacterium]|nr:glycoside hydrolase family 127 protein [Cyclobacteriaceae bacterium]
MNSKYLFGILAVLVSTVACQKQQDPTQAVPFPLPDVRLLEGPFKHATELNRKTLLGYEPDRLLAKFRKEAGLIPRAEHYDGWENQTIAGHSLGHYLSACALMYQTTQEEEFLNRVNYIVNELDSCQQADGSGYIGAFSKGKLIFEQEIAKGNIRAQLFDLNGLWAPLYTQHKVMAGLRDAYRLCGVEKALDVERRFADWLFTILEPLSDDQVQQLLNCEHGGINEMLVDLYADTHEKKYLEMSRMLHHKAILDSLALQYDILPGKHGNTQIPKLIGLARRYELTHDKNDSIAAAFFWDRVVKHHSYVTGGHGNHEYFGEPGKLRNRLSKNTTETCNVYNMQKLSQHLFQWNPRAEVADYYERALFNHILSSQHPESGRVIYNLSLEMGGHKVYQNPEWFTCCVGSGMENHAKYGSAIFYHGKNDFYVTQFIAAEVTWKDKKVTIRQQTNYPEEQGTSIFIETDEPQSFTVKIRYPYWAQSGVSIKVNEEPVAVSQSPGSFITLNRKWKSGDVLKATFPFSLRIERMPDDENRVAIMYGPLVLAGDLGKVEDTNSYDPGYVPVLLTESRNPADWLTPGEQVNHFTVDKVGYPRGFELKPFYKTHDRRYSVYWDIFNEEQWKAYNQTLTTKELEQKKLEEMTYDFFQPADPQSEKLHNFSGDSVNIITNQNRKAREANRGGWFAFDMKVMKGNSMGLVVEYWGGFTGSKTFDILINDEKIATENVSALKEGEYINKVYAVPYTLTATQSNISVKFLPHTGHRAGPIFAVRTIKQ